MYLSEYKVTQVLKLIHFYLGDLTKHVNPVKLKDNFFDTLTCSCCSVLWIPLYQNHVCLHDLVILTSKGLRLKYVAPGRVSRSICCLLVNTESRCSIALTCNGCISTVHQAKLSVFIVTC